MNKETVYALAGNPNSGKTTLFNEFTGSRQRVGNWPGVKVERKEGRLRWRGETIQIVDLPGTYSLVSGSPEEEITARFLMEGKADVVIHVANALHLERSLYLTLQLMEGGCPLVVALNMADRLKSRGLWVDAETLEKRLGVPVVPISALRGEGLDTLLHRAEQVSRAPREKHIVDDIYSPPVRDALCRIASRTGGQEGGRWKAVCLLEGTLPAKPADGEYIAGIVQNLKPRYGERDAIIAGQKYRYIEKLCAECAHKTGGSPPKSGGIEKAAAHPLWGLPLFFGIMALTFFLTFGPLGARLSADMEGMIAHRLIPWVRELLLGIHAAQWVTGFLCDGILTGVGAVASFFPQLLLLFFLLSALEDSGYMARAAFLADKLLSRMGLSGKSFVPLLLGFGCSVSGIMACRTLNSEKERRTTVLLTPFMSCSAKLPVYALITSLFFGSMALPVTAGLYIAGAVTAIPAAWLLKTLFRGDTAPFVMELPPYALPSLKTLWRNVAARVWDFMTRAGTVLLLAAVAVWFLRSFNGRLEWLPPQESGQSLLAAGGRLLAPLFAPLGFGFWQAAVALLAGLLAKEAVAGTLLILYSPALLQTAFTPPSALAFLTFVLLYPPCAAALAAMQRELRSLRQTLYAALAQTGIAWIASFGVYRLALFFYR